MKILSTRVDLEKHLRSIKEQGKSIGLVPTMGALHAGHIALVTFLRERCDVLVCSIFVNPTQFNNPEDLERYPRTLEADLAMLSAARCDVVFTPSVDEMYGVQEHWHIDLQGLDNVLEGAFRPGHFQGVTQIVKKLFDLVRPNIACFGQKDFQQLLVIKKMVAQLRIPIQIVAAPTVREPSGLAMSSRNVRLSKEGKKHAAILSQVLLAMSEKLRRCSLEETLQEGRARLEGDPYLQLEYLEICDTERLQPLKQWKEGRPAVILIAAWVEGIRLIDNLLID